MLGIRVPLPLESIFSKVITHSENEHHQGIPVEEYQKMFLYP